jgi:hypothetical protein
MISLRQVPREKEFSFRKKQVEKRGTTEQMSDIEAFAK